MSEKRALRLIEKVTEVWSMGGFQDADYLYIMRLILNEIEWVNL